MEFKTPEQIEQDYLQWKRGLTRSKIFFLIYVLFLEACVGAVYYFLFFR